MKKQLIISILLLIAITLFSCNTDTVSKESQFNHYKSVYDIAIGCNDYITAENAIYNEWALDTSNAISYKDSLINLFTKNGQYGQVVTVGKQVLIKRPDDLVLIGKIASADQNLNNLDEALSYDHIIYDKLHDLFHLYQIVLLQYSLSRTIECNQTIDQVLADTGAAHQRVPIMAAPGQPVQNVPYSAAVLNIRGVMARDQKQYDAAKKAFSDALAIDPDFKIAKNNLEDINKQK